MKRFMTHRIRSGKLVTFTATFLAAEISADAMSIPSTAVRAAPYDRCMAPVRQAFDRMHGEEATLERVDALMREGRAFRYTRSDPYTPAPPEKTASRRAGDCKDKALWLMSQLQDQNVRFVIGKLHRRSHIRHAWLLWEHDGREWILDCARFGHAIPADRFGPDEYVSSYSYSRGSAYRTSAN
jgi:hypothetical protein